MNRLVCVRLSTRYVGIVTSSGLANDGQSKDGDNTLNVDPALETNVLVWMEQKEVAGARVEGPAIACFSHSLHRNVHECRQSTKCGVVPLTFSTMGLGSLVSLARFRTDRLGRVSEGPKGVTRSRLTISGGLASARLVQIWMA